MEQFVNFVCSIGWGCKIGANFDHRLMSLSGLNWDDMQESGQRGLIVYMGSHINARVCACVRKNVG